MCDAVKHFELDYVAPGLSALPDPGDGEQPSSGKKWYRKAAHRLVCYVIFMYAQIYIEFHVSHTQFIHYFP